MISHEELLQAAQKEYLETGSNAAWGRLWEISYQVCKNITAAWCLAHDIPIEQEFINDKSMIACEYVLRRYDKKYFESAPKPFKERYPNGYYVNNFISTLKSGVKHAMLYVNRTDKDINDSIRFEQITPCKCDKVCGEYENNKRIIHLKKGTLKRLQVETIRNKIDDEQKKYYIFVIALYNLNKKNPAAVENYQRRKELLQYKIDNLKISIDNLYSMIY